MKVIKRQPTKNTFQKTDFSAWAEPSAFDALFMDNVKDIADTMAEIMVVCGIHRCKAKPSRAITAKAFQFYYIKRQRFEVADNECGISRDDIVSDFERKCRMTRLEALLAYCIVKRAVKAFFHGNPNHCVRSLITEAVVLKDQENIWLHAARRTIVLFERYEHMFLDAQRNYATQILNIYKELHDRLTNRSDPVIGENYHPHGCVKKVIVSTGSPPTRECRQPTCVKKCAKSQDLREYIENMPPKGFPLKSCLLLPRLCPLQCQHQCELNEPPENYPPPPKKRKRQARNKDLNLARCFQCNCPQLVCDCDINRDTGLVAIDCSQGPFNCQWVRVDKPDKPDPCIEKPEQHQCPVDCCTAESSSDTEPTEYCECSSEYEKDVKSDQSEKEIAETEAANSEETLLKMLPLKLSRKRNTTAYQPREISKLPLPKCNSSRRPAHKVGYY